MSRQGHIKRTFTKAPRWIILALLALLLTWLAACSGNNAAQSLVEPAPDRLTFVWIFSDP
jgi:hypothetical protein